jgi:hypothetical protein
MRDHGIRTDQEIERAQAAGQTLDIGNSEVDRTDDGGRFGSLAPL